MLPRRGRQSPKCLIRVLFGAVRPEQTDGSGRKRCRHIVQDGVLPVINGHLLKCDDGTGGGLSHSEGYTVRGSGKVHPLLRRLLAAGSVGRCRGRTLVLPFPPGEAKGVGLFPHGRVTLEMLLERRPEEIGARSSRLTSGRTPYLHPRSPAASDPAQLLLGRTGGGRDEPSHFVAGEQRFSSRLSRGRRCNRVREWPATDSG
jgi:hypothetical protein